MELRKAALMADSDAQQAMKLIRVVDKIDLLLTDVGLPNGMNGRQLADAVLQAKAGLPVSITPAMQKRQS